MMAAPENDYSSPALVEIARIVRSHFHGKPTSYAEKYILKAEEAAKIYFQNKEDITASELEVLYDVLREFGIIAAHIPQDFHVHVSNVIKFIQNNEKTVTKSHVAGIIFARM